MSISRKCARNGITSTAPLLRISIKKYNIFESGPFFDTVLRTGNLFGKNVRKTDPPPARQGRYRAKEIKVRLFFSRVFVFFDEISRSPIGGQK